MCYQIFTSCGTGMFILARWINIKWFLMLSLYITDGWLAAAYGPARAGLSGDFTAQYSKVLAAAA
jgi:hypothetical protein